MSLIVVAGRIQFTVLLTCDLSDRSSSMSTPNSFTHVDGLMSAPDTAIALRSMRCRLLLVATQRNFDLVGLRFNLLDDIQSET